MSEKDIQSNSPAVDMRNITMVFGSLKANDDINLTVEQQSVHAILGENGAGKSTLMNVLYGLLQPQAGTISIKGQPVTIDSPLTAIKLGIGMVHQHFMLVPPFTVTENIILGQEPMGIAGTVNMKKAREMVKDLSDRYGLDVDPDAKIHDISVSMQQRTEIIKVLYRGAETLILDEPTASLTPEEIESLAVIIKNLTKEGKTVIIITHKLAEIKAMADTCSIIRAGKHIATVNVDDVTEQDLASMMVGRNVDFSIDKKAPDIKCTVLNVKDLFVKNYRDQNAVSGLDLEVREGEIMGIAGVDGNGQSELIMALTGLSKSQSGEILLNGLNVTNKSPRKLFEAGVSSIPEDRHKHGLVLDFTVSENMVLQNHAEPEFANKGFLKKAEISQHAHELIEKFDVRPSDCRNNRASSLSGGNQQKVIIAREVTNNKKLLICANPTRGLDVGAIEYVHKYILEQRDSGHAVLLISFELDEIMKLSDRISVMFRGNIVGCVNGDEATESGLGFMMAGGVSDEAS